MPINLVLDGCNQTATLDYNTLRVFPGIPYGEVCGKYYVKDHYAVVAVTMYNAIRDAQRESRKRYWWYMNHARRTNANWWAGLDPYREHIFTLQRIDWGRCLLEWLDTQIEAADPSCRFPDHSVVRRYGP